MVGWSGFRWGGAEWDWWAGITTVVLILFSINTTIREGEGRPRQSRDGMSTQVIR